MESRPILAASLLLAATLASPGRAQDHPESAADTTAGAGLGGAQHVTLQDQAVLAKFGGEKGLRNRINEVMAMTDEQARGQAMKGLAHDVLHNAQIYAQGNQLGDGRDIAARIFEKIKPPGATSFPVPGTGNNVVGGGSVGLGAAAKLVGGGLTLPEAGRPPPPLKPTDAPQLQTLAQSLTATRPEMPQGWVWGGDAAAVQNKPEQAFKLYSAGIERGAPPEVYVKRGVLADRLGDSELANADARHVLEAEPDNRSAHSLYMLTRGRPSTVRLLGGEASGRGAGRTEAAPAAPPAAEPPPSDEFARGGFSAPAVDPQEIAARENAAMNGRTVTAQSAKLTRDAKGALKVHDANAALRLTDEALRADPNNADARYVRATAFLQLRQPEHAVQEASAGLDLAPGNAPLLYTRAIAFGRQKLWNEAFKDADEAVRNAPSAGYAYQARAAANWGLKRKADMMQDLRASARMDRSYLPALERASSLPDDVDPTLLMSDAAPQAAPSAPAAPVRSRYAFWLIGAGLAGVGLVPFLFPGVRRAATTILRRGPATAPEPEEGAEAPVTGFWKRYEVTREIGAGGMGIVYEAWDRNLDRKVAVKRMRDEIRNDRRERERFLQEARTVAQMRHPNLVEIFSIEEDGDDAYLVFEFVEGKTLHEHLQDKGRLSPAEAREVMRGICAGVDCAHRRGIVHRDLKPANVIIDAEGTVKVMDFGVARQHDAMARRQMTNTIIGTPPYMAPEQDEGVVCPQSDVYALGVVLYELLTGALPFQGTVGGVALAKREAKYEPLLKRVPDLPPALAQVVDRALDPRPESRIQSAADLMRAVDAALGGVPSQA